MIRRKMEAARRRFARAAASVRNGRIADIASCRFYAEAVCVALVNGRSGSAWALQN
jgi:hypothetical protein